MLPEFIAISTSLKVYWKVEEATGLTVGIDWVNSAACGVWVGWVDWVEAIYGTILVG